LLFGQELGAGLETCAGLGRLGRDLLNYGVDDLARLCVVRSIGDAGLLEIGVQLPGLGLFGHGDRRAVGADAAALHLLRRVFVAEFLGESATQGRRLGALLELAARPLAPHRVRRLGVALGCGVGLGQQTSGPSKAHFPTPGTTR
jgi:hypothetical protein